MVHLRAGLFQALRGAKWIGPTCRIVECGDLGMQVRDTLVDRQGAGLALLFRLLNLPSSGVQLISNGGLKLSTGRKECVQRLIGFVEVVLREGARFFGTVAFRGCYREEKAFAYHRLDDTVPVPEAFTMEFQVDLIALDAQIGAFDAKAEER